MAKPKQALPQWRNRIVGHGEEPPAQLLANPRNWRIHPKNQQDALAGVLDEVGFVQSVIVNQRSGFVVDGHARVAMAITRQQPTVPVVYVDIDDAEEALVLATLDPISALAGRDEELLASLIREVDIPQGALADLLAELSGDKTKPGLNPDDADLTPPTESITKPGDLWLLGDHRLLCGDATKPEDTTWLMGGERADMVLVDPPYGIDLDTDWGGRIGSTGYGREYRPVIGDNAPFDLSAVCTPACSEQFWWGADYYRTSIPRGGSWFVWDKRVESQDSMIGAAFELCWSSKEHKRELVRIPWVGFVAHDPREIREHPTQKPVELAAWFIERFSRPAEVIWDGFLGAGWTLLAAEQRGRRCFALEIDPSYCDVAVRRWETVTGRKAVLDGTPVEVHA